MLWKTTRSTAPGCTRPRSRAGALAAAFSLLTTAALAQVSAYTALPPVKLTTSTDPVAIEAAYQPITGGTLLVDGSQAATEANTVVGTGYSTWEAVTGFSWSCFCNQTTYRPAAFAGVAAFVGNGPEIGNGQLVRTGPGVPIGFDFTYNNEVFDRVGISAQGWISFGKSADGSSAVQLYTNTSASSTAIPLANSNIGTTQGTYKRNRVVAYGQEGGSYGSGSGLIPYVFQSGYSSYPGSTLRYETIGTAPNREFVVQWENYISTPFSQLTQDPAQFLTVNFQIRLQETTNKVEVRYGKVVGTTAFNGFSQVGLGGRFGGTTSSNPLADFNAWRIDQNVSSTWPTSWNNDLTERVALPVPAPFVQSLPTSTAPYNNPQGLVSMGRLTTPDMLSFAWTPPTCPQQATAINISSLDSTGATVSWSGTGTFDYVVSPTNNPNDANAVTGTVTANSATVSGLAKGTVYYAFVRTNCGAGDHSTWSTAVSFKTFFTVSCGTNWTDPGGAAGANPSDPYINTYVFCPTTPGHKATIDFSEWTQLNWNVPQASPLFIRDGYGLSAPSVLPGTGAGYSCTSCANSQPSWSVPAGGWITGDMPPTITSTSADGCLTAQIYSFGYWVNAGWQADVTCAPPPTCFPPTARTVTATTTQGASFSWNSGASPAVDYIVVASGGTPASPVLASGNSTTGTGSVTGLSSNTLYTAFFRGSCDGGNDLSAWSEPGLNFRTKVGCGSDWDGWRGNFTSYPNNMDSVITICPDNAGDVVTVTFSQFVFGQSGDDAMYVYDGPTTSSALLASNRGATSSGFPAGGYYGNFTTLPNPNMPAVFTSSHSGGCLTFRFRTNASQGSFYDSGFETLVSCAPAPACATPSGVSISAVTGTSATVTWTGTGTDHIIEYGPAGFTPGTDGNAGGGTIVTEATSGEVLNGLATSTVFDLYVRQVCDGPSYSANSFRVRFSTSMDCANATVLNCGGFLTETVDYNQSGSDVYVNVNYTSATCVSTVGQLSGVERLYRITAPETGTYQLDITAVPGSGAASFLTTPVSNGCGAASFVCIANTATNPSWPYGPMPSQTSFNLTAGDHYILMDPNSSTLGNLTFRVNCPGIPACVAAPTYPPNNGMVANTTTPIAFAWPASFGATGYDIYFNGGLVVSNHPTNSISSASYTPAAVAALVGMGNPVTWRVVPRNAYGTADCTTNYTFSVGGNGSANAVGLQAGVPRSGSIRAANGYTSSNSNNWGPDAWFSYTPSDCATNLSVSLCPTGGITPSSSNAYSDNGFAGLTIRRASDNAQVLHIEDNNAGVTSGCAGVYNFNTGLEDVPSFAVVSGETYYIIADGYGWQYNFNLTVNETLSTTDTDSDGTPDCSDSCPAFFGGIGDPCVAGANLMGTIDEFCECSNVECTANEINVHILTDAAPEQITWAITDEFGFTVAAGGPYEDAGTEMVSNECLSNTFGDCYRFKLTDLAGNGITGGHWELRDGNGALLLRDAFNGTDGTVSPATAPATSVYGSGHSFCLPAGPSGIQSAYCNVFTNLRSSKVYCEEVPGAVSYQFEFSDPDAGFIRRITLPRNWVRFSEMYTSPLVNGVTYFTRVRVDQGLTGFMDDHFGPGCEMAIITTAGCTSLIDNPGSNTHSCGVTRTFGGSSKLWATPVNGATQYRFRFTNSASGFLRNVTSSNYVCALNWVTAPLVNGVTYDVAVETMYNGVWTGFCGPTCTVTIGTAATRPETRIAEAMTGTADMQLWPNPNQGDRVNLMVSGFDAELTTVSVDVLDLFGKQVQMHTVAVNEGMVNTVLTFDNALANGVYFVRLTAGTQTTTQRLVIQR